MYTLQEGGREEITVQMKWINIDSTKKMLNFGEGGSMNFLQRRTKLIRTSFAPNYINWWVQSMDKHLTVYLDDEDSCYFRDVWTWIILVTSIFEFWKDDMAVLNMKFWHFNRNLSFFNMIFSFFNMNFSLF